MAMDKWERQSTWKSQVVYKSSNTAIDPSGSIAFIDVYDAEDNLILSNSGQRTSTGTYIYYVSTQSDDPLGIYRVRWRALFDYSGRWDYSPKYDTEVVQICKVKQD